MQVRHGQLRIGEQGFQLFAAGGVGGRNAHAQFRYRARDALRRFQERWREPLDFTQPAAGQQGQHRRVGRQVQRPPGGGAVRLQRHVVRHGVADEARIDAMAGVDGRFHREQAQHAVGAGADLLRALLAPGPDGGADVMHGADPALLEPALHAQVEVGGIDADEHIRPPGQHALAERTPQLQQAGQVAQYLGQAHHRQLARVEPGLATFAAHAIAADAGEFGVGPAFAQCGDEAGPQPVAGGLAGHQRDARAARGGIHLSSGLSPRSMKSSRARTSSLDWACSASCCLASASGRPATYNVR